MALHEPQRLIARAWLAAAEHSVHSAVELARKTADLAYSAGRYAMEAVALHHATRYGDRTLATRLTAAARPLPITEREIAALIGRGLSDRAIAERLCVSVRTVEGHIYRACIELDATDRDQLAELV